MMFTPRMLAMDRITRFMKDYAYAAGQTAKNH